MRSEASRPSVVVPAHARPDARDVRPVDVDRNRNLIAGVVDAVDITGRGEAIDVAHQAVARADEGEVGVVDVLVLDSLDDTEHAPRRVIVDARQLTGPPHDRGYRKGAVALDVERVAGRAVRRAEPLLGAEDLGPWEVRPQLVG